MFGTPVPHPLDSRKMVYTYEHPMLSVAVDIALLSQGGNKLQILLIQRKDDDKLALPGGFVNIDEPIEAAARRELFEETGLGVPKLHPFGIFDDPHRDYRGRVISHAYLFVIKNTPEIKPGDDASRAMWCHVDAAKGLAFDHDKIVQKALDFYSRCVAQNYW